MIHLEAEAGNLRDVAVAADRAGFSGSGYVTGFSSPTSQVSWKFSAKAGIYRAIIGFSTPSGKKGFDLTVNGATTGGMFPDVGGRYDRFDAGVVELKDGVNEASVHGGWNYYDIDYVEFRPAERQALPKPVRPTLIDPAATPEARALMRRIAATYGKKSMMGQYGDEENAYVVSKTGVRPSITAGDFMDYSPSRTAYGANPAGTTERMIAAAKKGQFVSMSWHWNAPTDLINKMEIGKDGKEQNHLWYKGFYTDSSTFDLSAAISNSSSERYRLLLRDIDAIAVELKKFADAKVPVLWRPLHEAEGGWFWWGAKGSEPCKKLWSLLQDRLVRHHKLHNLIWVWNSANPDWYPGDSKVDVMAIDAYPSDHGDVLNASWAELLKRFDGKKVLAVAEFPGPMDVDRMAKFGVWWAYNVSWTGDLGPKSASDATLRRIYRSPRAVVAT